MFYFQLQFTKDELHKFTSLKDSVKLQKVAPTLAADWKSLVVISKASA